MVPIPNNIDLLILKYCYCLQTVEVFLKSKIEEERNISEQCLVQEC